MSRITTWAIVFVLATSTAHAQEDGFVPLFNGKDLTGWHNVNCAPGTFYVKDNMIITTGIPTGYLRTAKQYENFILEFEWFHAPAKKGAVGNSGLFVWGDPIPAVGTGYTRGIEVQVLVNLESRDKKTGQLVYTSQGDLFSIWGAKCKPDRPHVLGWERCLPSEDRCKGEYEWNHYRVIGKDGVLKLQVNGKEVSGVSECKPQKGYLALESEGSECRFKNLKIKELPSKLMLGPDRVADRDKGLQCLFTGIDLAGWNVKDEQKDHWKMNDGVLRYDGNGKGYPFLWSKESYGDFELICDRNGGGSVEFALRGSEKHLVRIPVEKKAWSRIVLHVKGDKITATVNGKREIDGDGLQLFALPKSGPIALTQHDPAGQYRNLFIRELKGDE